MFEVGIEIVVSFPFQMVLMWKATVRREMKAKKKKQGTD